MTPAIRRARRGLALAAALGLAARVGYTQAAAAAPTAITLRGRVVQSATGRPIGGATVWTVDARGDTVRARSADDGAWRLTVDAVAPLTLQARLIGYRPTRVAVSAAAAGAPVIVAMKDVALALDAMVVTAARRPQELKNAVVATELVSQSDIRRTGASDLASVLTQRTGVSLDAGTPSGNDVAIEGLGDRRVLILLDGQPLVGRVNGNFDLSRVPTAMIDRVEIVRGPQSTLFGSDAMGGVINILTRPPGSAPWTARGQATVGGTGRRDVDGGLTAVRGSFGLAADGGMRHDGLAPGRPDSDGAFSERWNGNLRGDWIADRTAAGGLAVHASAFGVHERQRYRLGQAWQFSDNDEGSAQASSVLPAARFTLTPIFALSHFTHLSRAALTPTPASDSGARDVQDLAKATLQATGPVLGALIDAGFEARRDRITADRVPGGNRSLDALEPYAQATIARGPASLVPGVRVTWSSAWGTAVTPRLAALVRPVPRLALRASVARGFRAPDFKELYLDFVNAAAGYAVAGNPDLRPERSVNTSLGAEWAGDVLYGRVNLFLNRYRDFIDFRLAGAPGAYTYGNIGQGYSRGAEFETGMTVGRWRADAGWSLLATRDDATGQTLLGQPARSGHVGLSARAWRGIDASLTALYSSATPIARDSSGAVTQWRPAFPRIDLHASLPIVGGTSLSGGVDNLLDRRLGPDWPGFTGRVVYVGLGWQAPGVRH